MIYGIGTDLIEVGRVKKQLLKENGFKQKIFSSNEISYCESKAKPAEHFAARFAAKEAFFKALGTGWRFGMKFNEIEIINNELGKPEIILAGVAKDFSSEKKISNIHLSISHLKEIANAIVILETITK